MLLIRRAVAEAVGSAFLLIAVIGSGIAAQRLSPGQTGLELLENAIATGAALVALILTFGSVSGAHFNPVVSLVAGARGGLPRRDLPVFLLAQVAGAVAGAVLANLMFSLPAVSVAGHVRDGGGVLLGEVVATFGLILVIVGVVESGRMAAVPFAVGAYITGAYFFTSSTSFANPAVTVARMFSDSFAGIAPRSVPAFIGCQLLGGAAGLGAALLLWPRPRNGPRRA